MKRSVWIEKKNNWFTEKNQLIWFTILTQRFSLTLTLTWELIQKLRIQSKLWTWHHCMKRLATAFCCPQAESSTSDQSRSPKPKAVKTIRQNLLAKHHRLFSRKHMFYKVWQYRSVCTCRHTVAINLLLRLANQISRKVATNTPWLAAASISHPQRAAVPPPVGLVKSQQSAVPAVPLLSSQQQGAELKNIVWHLGARCWEQINLIRLELCAPDSPNLQHNNWGAESPQSRPSFTLLCYYHLLLPHRKTHGSAKHSEGASFG